MYVCVFNNGVWKLFLSLQLLVIQVNLHVVATRSVWVATRDVMGTMIVWMAVMKLIVVRVIIIVCSDPISDRISFYFISFILCHIRTFHQALFNLILCCTSSVMPNNSILELSTAWSTMRSCHIKTESLHYMFVNIL